MKKAYSYTRFSSKIQSKGGSRIRQLESFEVAQFIRNHKLNVVQYIADEGVSGFHGKNFSNTAALGKFIEEIRAGRIETGSVLICENLDRFSRDKITDCISRFTEIIQAGVSIGIVSMNLIIDLEQMNNNGMIWNYVSNEFQRARSESKRKSEFQKNNIAQKIERAKQGELIYFGAQCPSYIKGVENKKWIVDKDSILTIKRVFDLYISGMSCVGIAKQFNQEKVRLLVGNIWSNPSVRHILNSKNLIGYCKVNDFESDNYYPKIIDSVTFNKVQARLAHNKSNRGGSTTGNVPNIFKGLMFCKCGGGIDVQGYKYKDKVYSYCQCRNAPLRLCNDKTKWRADRLEETIFFMILEKSPAELLTKPKTKGSAKLEKLNTDLSYTKIIIHRFMDMLSEPELTNMNEIKSKLVELNKKMVNLKNEIQVEESKQAVLTTNPETIIKLKDIFSMSLENELIQADKILADLKDTKIRFKLRALMPDLISRIDLDLIHNTFVVTMSTGVKKDMLFV